MSEPRFVVSSVTGATINPAVAYGHCSHPLGTDYYVLDRAYCHREVARFTAEQYRNQNAAMRKRKAEAKAAELNAAELNAWDAKL